jgi:hypothetical protein
MKFSKALILLISLLLMSTPAIFAQDWMNAEQTADNLRAQLRDVQTEEAELQTRLQQLEWDLKPENIERYFAANGSTRPEELREQRRRQLQHEKDRALVRLEQLATSRTRLESAIAVADAEAYMKSAESGSAFGVENQMLGTQYLTNTRLLTVGLFLVAILGALLMFAVIRRRRRLSQL